MTKAGKGVFIASLIFLICGIGIVIAAGIGGASFKTMRQSVELPNYYEDFKKSDVDSLSIGIAAAELSVVQGEELSVSIINGLPGGFDIYLDEGVLYIEEDSSRNWFNEGFFTFNPPVSQVVVTVPADMSLEEVDIEIAAGTAYFGVPITKRGDFSCSAGTMTLQLPGYEQDYRLDVENVLGEIRVGDRHYSGVGNEYQNDDPGDIIIVLDCSAGKIDVSFTG